MSFLNAEVNRSLQAPCSRIWEIITDTHTWPEWGPSVREVQCPTRFIHKATEGKVKTAVGIWLPFIITGYEEGRFWSWKVAHIPATGHRVAPQGDAICKLTFEIPLFASPYAYVCKVALDRIERMLEY
jgi:hypothetical protein